MKINTEIKTFQGRFACKRRKGATYLENTLCHNTLQWNT